MKKAAICMLMCVVAALAIAAEKKEVKTREAAGRPDRVRRPIPMQRRGDDAAEQRRRGYRQMLARRAEMHAAEIAELEAIKKIAEEEQATRTVEAIQALIDKKDAEFKERMATIEKQRRERAEQIQQRTQRDRPRTQKDQTNNDDTTKDQKSKATSEKADKKE